MNKLERYLNFLYWGIERKTRRFEYGAWRLHYIPTLSILAVNFYLGLINLYLIEVYLFAVFITWYFYKRTELHYFFRDVLFSKPCISMIAIVLGAIAFLIGFVFVMYKGKYRKYYRQFEQLPKEMQSAWTWIAVLLFLLALVFGLIIGGFRTMYIPK